MIDPYVYPDLPNMTLRTTTERLRDAGLGEHREPGRLTADLELYDATEFRTRPTSPLSRPSKQRERKRKINRVVYDSEDDD